MRMKTMVSWFYLMFLPLLVLATVQEGKVSEKALQSLSKEARESLLEAKIGPLSSVPVPPNNPQTKEKVELGRLLYFDKRLSADKTISCATCHDPKFNWAEAEATSTGIRNQKGDRNSPTILNSAFYHAFFWDGRAGSLEEQALGPVQNPIEMGNDLKTMVATIDGIAGYKPLFSAAFGDGKVNPERVAQAIASFERTVVTGPSPLDEFLMGKTTALTPQQKRGLELFLTKGNCVSCHHGPFLTSQDYMPTNLQGDEGRAKVTKNLSDKGLFRIPTLRNVGLTGPYFHNGAVTSLDEAVFLRANNMRLQEYKGKGTPDPSSLVLNETEVKDVAAFLKALNGKMPAIFEPKQFPQ
jgi:cytochrome c peroxidase